MKKQDKKQALALGIRVSIVFLMTVVVLFSIAYYVLSQNFKALLTNYTIELIQSMTIQGVEVVTEELEDNSVEIAAAADSWEDVTAAGLPDKFPKMPVSGKVLRMVYVSDAGTVASDGRKLDIRDRQDIITALAGKTAIYGPYFNEAREFVVCYSAPVRRSGKVIGVLSVEKDGYRFCELIKHIRFVNSGESYIINAEGTDIAVSEIEHMDWVNSQYNARRLLKQHEDSTTKSILDLEAKGLAGESGVGTYYWNDGLCYVVYKPIPVVNWVLLVGLREEEIIAMTQSVLLASVSKGPTLVICLTLFFILMGLIVYWIILSMKKNAEINDKLEFIANHDTLTGLLNRRFIETQLLEQWKFPVKIPCQAAVFMVDIDNFKKYNDHYGHLQGDDCLRQIAAMFRHTFDGYQGSVVRYGGEEFVAAVFLIERQAALELGEKLCRSVEAASIPDGQGGSVTVSVGLAFTVSTIQASLYECIRTADEAMYEAKQSGKNRVVILDVTGSQQGDGDIKTVKV